MHGILACRYGFLNCHQKSGAYFLGISQMRCRDIFFVLFDMTLSQNTLKFNTLDIAGNACVIIFCCNIFINNAQALSNEQKQQLEKELDSLFLINVKAAELLDIKKLYDIVDDTYNAGFITAGRYYSSFDTLMMEFKSRAQGIDSQTIFLDEKKITLLSEKYAIITARWPPVRTIKTAAFIRKKIAVPLAP